MQTHSTREFHISRQSRKRYDMDETLFSLSGNVIFANYHQARMLAHNMNQQRDTIHNPEQSIHASHIYAMGLIDEILHYIVQLYQQTENPQAMKKALAACEEIIGKNAVHQCLKKFITEFPSIEIYREGKSIKDDLADLQNQTVALEEMLMLWLANENPAFSPFKELFDDKQLSHGKTYRKVMTVLHQFFETQPPFGPDHQNLIDMLRSPALHSPHSLFGQLEFIRSRWQILIQDRYLYKLLAGLDFIREEEKDSGHGGAGPSEVMSFHTEAEAPERFSHDLDWMPKVVLIAKNIYVWLDQLSKTCQRSVTRLDQIPDEVLDSLKNRGFTGLWLIGVWERSPASKRIKQMCGNPEAEASAYALYDYVIAGDLGGEQAFEDLKRRAWQRGIRMSGDMVPNHVGIDAKWVEEHPDWFISLPYSPFPAYTFNGPDLSHDDRVGIYLEDHYYNRSDAAVVFKRRDHWTGDERYIYHGNDGTSMPWNDTAQINFLNPEAREAVIQTILHVARQFPIIRFDAAMTLAKKHVQRLWFPESGSGGAIASRAEQGLTQADFDTAMPQEFWREVVDRVAAEAPDTLLLAEAFWMLESYFVRTLGMHRVYNSAFMNMLKNEENAKYRTVIRNTLDFNPEILKRFVNFMNNPDEDTAVAQFGKDDKYFGVCILMTTMPGLPMFGHGQIEGLTEKYGMEYRRAYREEQPDEWLIRRHEREIFPLLRKRRLFAEVRRYHLYDVVAPEGYVLEDVYAQSNQSGDERALVVYHNKWADVHGFIKTAVSTGESLGEGLELHQENDLFIIFCDRITGLEYIRNSHEFFHQGLYVELGAFKYHVFMDFREVRDTDGAYQMLGGMLNGRGIPSVDEALKEMKLSPIRTPFRELMQVDLRSETLYEESGRFIDALIQGIQSHTHLSNETDAVKKMIITRLSRLSALVEQTGQNKLRLAGARQVKQRCQSVLSNAALQKVCVAWSAIQPLGLLADSGPYAMMSRSWIDEWMLAKVLETEWDKSSWEHVMLIKILTGHLHESPEGVISAPDAYTLLKNLFTDADVHAFLNFNRHQDALWFNRERFDLMLSLLACISVLLIQSTETKTRAASKIRNLENRIVQIQKAVIVSKYQVDQLLEVLLADKD